MANIVIVGANQGIGYHMAKRLLELNHSVVVLDIDISNIRQLQRGILKRFFQSLRMHVSFPILKAE